MKSLTKATNAARVWATGSGRSALAATLRQAFDWAYDRAVGGELPGVDGAEKLARRYAARHANIDDAVGELIAWQSGVAGAAGFLTGCGGFVALPAALTANLAGALFIQARLIAAIAHLRGHDVQSDEVRRLALACLTGSKAADTLKDAGVRFGTRVARDTAGWMSPALAKKLAHGSHAVVACGAGARGASRLGRVLPVVGGIIAGGFDAAMTQLIGRTADRVFRRRPPGGADRFIEQTALHALR